MKRICLLGAALLLAILAPTRAHAGAGSDDPAPFLTGATQLDCLNFLYGGGDTHWMSAKLSQCRDDNAGELIAEYLRTPQVLGHTGRLLYQSKYCDRLAIESMRLERQHLEDNTTILSLEVENALLKRQLEASEHAKHELELNVIMLGFLIACLIAWIVASEYLDYSLEKLVAPV